MTVPIKSTMAPIKPTMAPFELTMASIKPTAPIELTTTICSPASPRVSPRITSQFSAQLQGCPPQFQGCPQTLLWLHHHAPSLSSTFPSTHAPRVVQPSHAITLAHTSTPKYPNFSAEHYFPTFWMLPQGCEDPQVQAMDRPLLPGSHAMPTPLKCSPRAAALP